MFPRHYRIAVLTPIILFCLFSSRLAAEEMAETEETAEEVNSIDKVLPFMPGIIFNTSNILLDLEEYQAGVGLMMLGESHSFRGSFGFSYESAANFLGMNISFAYLRPIIKGRVTPYWGVGVTMGYSFDKDTYDADDWQSIHSFEGGVSAVLGVEVFVFDFLSLFAEYDLGVSIAWSKVVQSSSGIESDSQSFNYSLGTGIGNGASIGVVVYLDESARRKAGRTPKDTSESGSTLEPD
jgi:hypothetical protein